MGDFSTLPLSDSLAERISAHVDGVTFRHARHLDGDSQGLVGSIAYSLMLQAVWFRYRNRRVPDTICVMPSSRSLDTVDRTLQEIVEFASQYNGSSVAVLKAFDIRCSQQYIHQGRLVMLRGWHEDVRSLSSEGSVPLPAVLNYVLRRF